MSYLPVADRMMPVLNEYVQAFGELRGIVQEDWIGETPTYPPTLNQTLRFFLDAMMMRARGVYILLVSEGYWDSEIVLRSLYEAFARCLTFATSSDPEPLLKEFWSDQLASDDRRTALKAGQASKVFPKGNLGVSVMAALTDERLFEVAPKLNKKERRVLNQKWSFAELVEELGRSTSEFDALGNADSLLHMYGMQSAVAHVSAKFYDLLWDRAIRGEDLEPLENGHVCRQLSDAVWLTAAAMFFSLRAIGVDRDGARRSLLVAAKFSEAMEPHVHAFDSSQRSFYQRMGHL